MPPGPWGCDIFLHPVAIDAFGLKHNTLFSHREAAQNVCRVVKHGGWDLWCHRSHYRSWWPENPVWATPLDPPAHKRHFQLTHKRWAQWKQIKTPISHPLKYSGTIAFLKRWRWFCRFRGEPRLTVGCYAGGSIRCPPWCPRLAPCSTLLPSDPGLVDLFHWKGNRK